MISVFSNYSDRGGLSDFDWCSLSLIASGVLHGLEEGSKGSIPSKPGGAISLVIQENHFVETVHVEKTRQGISHDESMM